MKFSFYFLIVAALLSVSACQDDDFSLPVTYDAEREIVITGFSRTESGQMFRVDLEEGASRKFLNASNPTLLDLPLGTRQLFDFQRMRAITQASQNSGVVSLTPVIEEDQSTTEIPLLINGERLGNTLINKMLLKNNGGEVLLIYRGGDLIYNLDLTTNDITLFTDSLDVGRNPNASRFLLSPDDGTLYHFNSEDLYSDQLQIFDLNTLTLERSVPIPAIFGLMQHPVNGRIFGVSAPINGNGYRLVEITPEASAPVRTISTTDLPIDNISPTLQAIHSASNTLILLTGNNSIETPTNELLKIDLTTGNHVGTTGFLPGQIITAIFAE